MATYRPAPLASEKTFRRMTARPTARHAYVEAEVATALAHQIRVLRQQRGWTQRELAHRLGTTQAAISRLEDPAYGKPTLKTLMDLAKVFDTGLQVRFVSFVQMLNETWQPKHQDLHVEPFEQEAPQVHFHEVGRTAPPAVRVQVPVAPSVGPAVRLMPLPDAVTAPIIHLADTSSAVTVLDHAH
jgi:transcriptional regulator with XRE-family HTH domain